MQVITEINGRTILHVPTEEVYPREGTDTPEAFGELARKYGFTVVTDLHRATPADIDQKGFQFRAGEFLATQGPTFIKDFTIFNWGVVVNTHNTQAGEEFIHDALKTLAEKFNFRTAPVVGKRMFFVSELLVQFEDIFDGALRNFASLQTELEREFVNHYGLGPDRAPLKFKVNGLGIDFERQWVPEPLSDVSQFVFERRRNTSFDENKYFARAPFRTREHIRLLGEMERLLKAH